jgi:hypothetical protein
MGSPARCVGGSSDNPQKVMPNLEIDQIGMLPENLRELCQRGLVAWKSGALPEARALLEDARGLASWACNRDGHRHALHLLGCVAYSERNDTEARSLHEAVLEQCEQLAHLAWIGSSLYDLAMIDLVEGDVGAARARLRESARCYESAGYPDRLRIVKTALDKLTVSTQPSR